MVQQRQMGRARFGFCGFCKKNGEPANIYTSHRLNDRSSGRVGCPYLRELVCDICGATGDNAHTKTYCPHNTQDSKKSIPLLLKKTKHTSCGKLRKGGVR